jgi:hypothetical protein
VYVNGSMLGRVASISVMNSTPRKALYTIDSVEPVELMQQSVSGHGQMSIYRLHQDGGIQALGMAAVWEDVSREKYFSLLILDRATDTVLFQADRCSTISESWSFNRSHVMGDVAFSFLRWSNGMQPSQA